MGQKRKAALAAGSSTGNTLEPCVGSNGTNAWGKVEVAGSHSVRAVVTTRLCAFLSDA